MNKNSAWFKVWDVFYPFLLYYAVLLIFFNIASLALGRTDESYMYCQVIATALTLPVMYFNFYRNQLKDAYLGTNRAFLMIMVIPVTLLISVSLNNIILMMPFAAKSAGYAQAQAGFFGSAIWVQILGSGILTPILEELVFRGIIFGRLRRSTNMPIAIIGSALLFACIHLNLVQFPYALILGIVLAIFVEMTKSVWAAIIGHITANMIVIFRTEYGWLNGLMDKSLTAWLISAILMIVGIVLLVIIVKRERKN